MPSTTFIAFSSLDPLVVDTITAACDVASNAEQSFAPWNRNDTSGLPIDKSVRDWVATSSALIADISEVNHNVTFEIGYAIGLGNPVRLIRSASKDRKQLEEIGLLHNIGHDDYRSRSELVDVMRRAFATSAWPRPKKNTDAPVYILQASSIDDLLRRVTSDVKKIMKMRYRNFNPREIDRLTATEAFEAVAQSFGILAFWRTDGDPQSLRQNQRAAFAIGIAKGLEIPFMLFAHSSARLPLDLDEGATRYTDLHDIDAKIRDFRELVAEAQEEYVEIRTTGNRFLDKVYCGDPTAENEAAQLGDYFLETEQFRLTLDGHLNVVLGRKGSGKSAIFIQVRNKIRANKNNIVVDLAPEGFQLIKLKEFVLEHLSLGTRKELIAAFWEYIIWLEIAHKLLEKDAKRVRNDSRVLVQYERLRDAYNQRADNYGDFAERLSGLTERIIARYRNSPAADAATGLNSTRVVEIVYGKEIRPLRDQILEYLKIKGIVCFLFDNLDRFWTPVGFGDLDAQIIVGLVECLQEIRRRFARAEIQFQWAIFLRSDVYEFVVKSMADYSKLASTSVEWDDRELLTRLFQQRVLQGFSEAAPSWVSVWERVTVPTVAGIPTLDYLINASLMRPRYLIRLFETARRRAITLGRAKIEEADYTKALEELGWQVLEDFDRELVDVVPDANSLFYDLSQLGGRTSLSDLRDVISKKVSNAEQVDAVVDVLIWTGCLGVRSGGGVVYISDCGFKRPFLRSLIKNPDDNCLVFHPTLAILFGAPGSRAAVPLRKTTTKVGDDRQAPLPGISSHF